ncbi:cytokinin hydroxylase-like [Hordeum vulgare]|nr:cytokinin hydroxylase-like [Hordeum vulgare]
MVPVIVLVLLASPLLLLANAIWVTASCYFFTPARIRRILSRQGVHGPAPRLLVGNLHDVSALVAESTAGDMGSLSHDIVGRLLPHYVLWSKAFGRLFVYWYGSEPRVCVTDAGMVRELLSSKHAHVTGKSWLQRQGAKHFIGRGLLMANGATWSHQRHVVAPAFMADKLRGRVGHMVECTRQTVRRCGRRWRGAGTRYFPSKYRREMKRLNGELEQVLRESIQRNREIADEGRTPTSEACGRGLLGMLLAEMEKKKKKNGFGHGELGYDAQTIIDECKTFFFAGHETSALLLTWAIMLLATHPEWQDKARAEVAQVCGDAPPAADHLPKLTVLQMVINETLRLYPPATLLPRMAFEDITLSGGLRVPRGASVWIPLLAIHHDEAVWGADAHEFRPDRFAPGRSRPGAGRFLPFAAGPRNCVGQAYAMVEAKVVLAMLLASFRFGISDEYRHAPMNVLTLRPRHGVPVRLLPLPSL